MEFSLFRVVVLKCATIFGGTGGFCGKPITFHVQDQLDPVLDPAPRAPRHAEVVLARVLSRLLAGLHVQLGVEPAAVAVVGLGHEGVEVEEGGVLGVVVEEHVGAVLGGEVAHGHGLLFRGFVPGVEVVEAFPG